MNVTDFATFVGTMGSGFLLGTRSLVKLLKKVIKIAPVIVGLFIATLGYSQYQGIIHRELVIFQKLLHQGITI